MQDGFRVCNEGEPRRVWEAVRVDNEGRIAQGEFWFTFDKEKVFNFFSDYPHALSLPQKKIFDEEYPFWREFFANK
ncbi:MAG: hypothetical protein MSC53_04365 [Arcanobacterium sp.]|nr:hypothetical protein [Arcanobacterium sp.]